MSQDAAFLEQIAADPDDDGPRLVYADWLEEQGDERAELIRVQCALAAAPHPKSLAEHSMAEVRALLDERRRLLLREKQWLARYGDAWQGAIRGNSIKATLRRGFFDELQTSAADLAKVASQLAVEAPALRVLTLVPRSNGLELTKAFDAVEQHPPPVGLRVLEMMSCELDPGALARMLRSPWLARLRKLNLAWNLSLGGLAVDWLDGQWPLGELEELDLRGITLSREAREMFAASPALRRLRLLTIGRQPRRTYLQLREIFGDRLLAM
jgi:uncharacterized protein (TIGR02996 family)